ncbi:hypothetical protein MKW92_006591 [Papaver armeniacum]|nr:hypothetical protein MKW92_006591 [Papaver armeniacum]
MKDDGKVDCIDINKQPSMDHPLLKDHLRPSSYPKNLRSKSFSPESSSRQSWGDVKLGYSCPKGTVPIRRITKEDRTRAKLFLKSFQSGTNNYYPNTDVVEPPGQHVAVRHSYNVTGFTPPVIYRGIQGKIKIDNPIVQKDQISASILWVEGGPADIFSTIQAGWVVAPTIFGDNNTHLSIYWRSGPDHGNCFNMYCEGFIQVNTWFHIGHVFPIISKYGTEDQYSFTALLFQDAKTRNWWFTMIIDNNIYDIGYLPWELVPYLDPANYIAWGGLVKSPPGTPSPQMGNGYFPDGDFQKVSAIWDHFFVDQTYTLVIPEVRNFENRFDSKDCYTVEDDSNTSIFFGGPGGNC